MATAPDAPNFSIVIPAYMEARGIVHTLEALAAFLASRDYGTVEVLVVVADSPDGTAELARQQAKLFNDLRVLEVGARAGKGRDVRSGMLAARGKYRIFMDADLATPIIHLDEAYGLLKHGAPVVIATRDLVKIHKDILRKFMSKFGNLFAQVMILPGIKDTQCGFKGFSAAATEAIFRRQTMLGWSFDAEILKIARLRGYRIATIEISDWHDPKTAEQGLVGDSPLQAAIKTFWDIIVIRLNAWRGVYKSTQNF